MPDPTPETTLACSPWPFLAPPESVGEIGRLERYRVLRLLGKGGMGMVFQAEDTQLRRLVALKVMLPEVAAQEQSRVRFLREARAAAALKHDHVVTIYQVGEDRGVPFLAMEFLKGKSLADWLAGGRQASVAETLIIGRQVAKGLAAAHKAGLIHRDIKPANLWLEAPAGRVKVLDFGLARWSELKTDNDPSQMTQQGEIVGTPAFMAPEQARGESVTARSDLFSLGCVLYRLASGRPPFAGDSLVAVLSAVMTHTPSPVRELNPAVPERLAALIQRLLAKQPADRPASAQAVLDDLVEIHEERKATADTTTLDGSDTIHLEPGTSGPMAVTSGASHAPRRHWLLAGVLLAGSAALAVLGIVVVGSGNTDSASIPQPIPAEPEPPGPPLGEPVDLLALIDVQRHTKGGRWSRDDEKVTVGQKGEPARFATTIPWIPPAEYRLRLVVEHARGQGNLGIGLASGDARFNLLIDTEHEDKHLTGISNIDGLGIGSRRDPWRGRVLSRGIPRELTIIVRKDRIALQAGETLIYEWQGDLGRTWRSPRQPPTPLLLFGTGPGAMQFHKIVLEPLGEDRGRPLQSAD